MRIVRSTDLTTRRTDDAKFTSDVWRSDILTADGDGLRSNQFTYAPGQRSHWHVHEGEQALIVVAGRGLIMWEGLDVAEEIGPGDWVHVTPHVRHWHGAMPDSVFVHFAVTATGGTRWSDPVSDDAYADSVPGRDDAR